MVDNYDKEWTLLVYANGNNELEPEINKAFKALKIVPCESVQTVIEIGRESKDVVDILRLRESSLADIEDWSGVRRYHLIKDECNLIKNLGSCNMADPNHLYQFIFQGITTYPAKHYMLLILGPGSSYIGVLADYSGLSPYIMELPAMCNAIGKACMDTKSSIEILGLDMNEMNYIEVINEICVATKGKVKYLVTAAGVATAVSFPYDSLYRLLSKSSEEEEIDDIIERLFKDSESRLLVISLNQLRIKVIKEFYSTIAYLYILSKKGSLILPEKLFDCIKPSDIYYRHYISLKRRLRSILKWGYDEDVSIFQQIKIISKPMFELMYFYNHLDFSNNSFWPDLIGEEEYLVETAYPSSYLNKPSQMVMEEVKIMLLTSNPKLGYTELEDVYYNLSDQKAWNTGDGFLNKLL